MEKAKRIIVVDDDAAILDAVRTMLQRKGYGVTAFTDSDALLEGTFEVPDVFIIDKQLPGVDGLDVCRYLKDQPATKDIPVLILSASPHIGAQAKAAGAADFLEKPFKMQRLRETVQQLLEQADSG